MEKRRPATIAAEHGHRIKAVELPFPVRGAKYLTVCTCNWSGKRPRHTKREVKSEGAWHLLEEVKKIMKARK